MERAGELLIITGRGNGSESGVSVVRQAVAALLPSLRRRNVITGWQEHTPGSFVVTLAPVAALFDAPKRRRERDVLPEPPASLSALLPETLADLRRLAIASLEQLGVQNFDAFVEQEMTTTFAALSATLATALAEHDDDTDPEALLHAAIRHAIDELES